MKRCIVLLLAVGFSATLLAQKTAQVTLWCTSLRFEPATTGTQTLQFTSDSNRTEINGEVFPLGDPNLPEYGTFFVLDDPSTASSINGQIAFDGPERTDANGDGFDDFLQIDQAGGPGTAQGIFTTPVDKGTVTATWSRAAGSSTGTCKVQMVGQSFGQLPAFSLIFELLTYRGQMTYTPGTVPINAALSVTNLQSSSNVLSGPMTFVRSTTNRFNVMLLLPQSLTNNSGQAMPYSPEEIQRDEQLKTNYFGFLDFQDGDPATSTVDYQTYVLSIDDPNDADGNGVPDLTDDTQAAPGDQPTLNLTRAANQLLLSINAKVGSSFNVEETPTLTQTNWLKITTVTLTNNPQTLSLPLPDSPARFWRLRSR